MRALFGFFNEQWIETAEKMAAARTSRQVGAQVKFQKEGLGEWWSAGRSV
jgi:hypothetical protein